MADYTFETITAAQALAYTAGGDSLAFAPGTNASAITVFYVPAAGADPARVSITVNGVTKIFGTGIYGETSTTTTGSILYIGDPAANDGPIAGTSAADGLYGGDGNDTLTAANGSNFVQGNGGNDSLTAGTAADQVYGGQGNDQIVTGGGNDFAHGNLGNDTITGGNGTVPSAETLLGGQGIDSIIGGAGADYINGNLGTDTLTGGTGNDTLLGEGSNDTIEIGRASCRERV